MLSQSHFQVVQTSDGVDGLREQVPQTRSFNPKGVLVVCLNSSPGVQISCLKVASIDVIVDL